MGEEASTDEVAQEQPFTKSRLVRGGVIGLVALMVLGLAGVGLREQLTSARVSNAENKWLGGQLFFRGDAQLQTGNMGTIVPYLSGTTNPNRYLGDLKVTGFVSVYSSEVNAQNGQAYQQIMWNLYGVDPRCSPPSRAITVGTPPVADSLEHANSCGIHIHQATSCAEEAGPHYYNKANTAFSHDVWHAVNYNAFETYFNGVKGWNEDHTITNAQGGTTIVTGLGLQQVQGHVIIVHDFDGTKIACGVLQTTGGGNPWRPDMTLAPTPAPR